MAAKVQINMRIRREFRDVLKERALRENRTLSNLVDTALMLYLQKDSKKNAELRRQED